MALGLWGRWPMGQGLMGAEGGPRAPTPGDGAWDEWPKARKSLIDLASLPRRFAYLPWPKANPGLALTNRLGSRTQHHDDRGRPPSVSTGP